jgi:hypothetical protein
MSKGYPDKLSMTKCPNCKAAVHLVDGKVTPRFPSNWSHHGDHVHEKWEVKEWTCDYCGQKHVEVRPKK